jgi:sec-independent protein translocase protein TatA
MFGNLGAGEIILIVLAILLLFGAKKIPELARGIGKGMGEFKKGLKDVEDEIKNAEKDSKKIDDKKN